MAFGKRGRPPEDRLAHQQEIYDAVSPLILQYGVRGLSMQQAASAACLSIGGLYHYFPTKRDLVLFGFRPDAILRRCQDFHRQYDHLATVDPVRYGYAGIELLVRHVASLRPSLHAALELGTASFWEVIDTLLSSSAVDFEVNVRRACPVIRDHELQLCGQAVRRSLCAALLDKRAAIDEVRDELCLLVDGYLSRSGRAGPALADVAGSVAASAH